MLNPNCPNCGEPYASVALMGKKVLKDIMGKSDLACAVCALQKQLINGMSCRYTWNQNRVKQTEQRIVKRHANFIINYTRFIHDLIIYALHYWTLLYQQEYAHSQVFQSKHVAL